MNSNLDDFDAPPNFEEAPVEQQQSPRSRISETLKTNPVFKIFLILVAGGALASAALGIFSGEQARDNPSIVGQAGDVTSTPGGQASPAFQQAVVEASQQRASGAVETGGSALPTPLGGQTQITTLEPGQFNPNEDPLTEFRAEAVEPPVAQAPETPPPLPIASSGPNFGQYQPQVQAGPDPALSQAMAQQMQTMMGAWQPAAPKIIAVAAPPAPPEGVNDSGDGLQDQPQGQGKILVPAGTINYGQMLLEANSDVPGPVMAQIMSGPFAGGRAIGSFQVQQDLLLIQFNLVSLNGKDYPVDILALNPDTTLGGLATETDQRYWSRIILPAAADFISGFANSFAQADQSVTVQDGVVISSRAGSSFRRGLGEGMARTGERIGEALEEQGNTIQPLVKVAAGTPVGLFFASSVYENEIDQSGYGQYGGYGGYGGYGAGFGQNPYVGGGIGGGFGQQFGGGVGVNALGNQFGGVRGGVGGVPVQNYGQNYGQGGNNTGFFSGGSGYNNPSLVAPGYGGAGSPVGSPNSGFGQR